MPRPAAVPDPRAPSTRAIGTSPTRLASPVSPYRHPRRLTKSLREDRADDMLFRRLRHRFRPSPRFTTRARRVELPHRPARAPKVYRGDRLPAAQLADQEASTGRPVRQALGRGRLRRHRRPRRCSAGATWHPLVRRWRTVGIHRRRSPGTCGLVGASTGYAAAGTDAVPYPAARQSLAARTQRKLPGATIVDRLVALVRY